jgi:hypothetical protein
VKKILKNKNVHEERLKRTKTFSNINKKRKIIIFFEEF